MFHPTLQYCKSCGRISHNLYSDIEFVFWDLLFFSFKPNKYKICESCHGENVPLSEEVFNKYKNYYNEPSLFEDFIKDYVSKSPYYNPEKAKEEIERVRNLKSLHEQQQAQRKKERDEASNKYWAERVAKEQAKHPECPYCHSTHTHKISTAGRVVDTAIFGIASDTIGKSFQCDNCGATF